MQYSSDAPHSNSSQEAQSSSEAHSDKDTSPQSSSSERIDPNDPKYTYEVIPANDSFIANYPPYYVGNNQVSIKSILKPVESGHYVIPETIDGKEVICVEARAFVTVSDKYPVKSVTLPKTLKGIDYNAFVSCTELTDIYMPAEYLLSSSLEHPNNELHTITIHCPENLPAGLGIPGSTLTFQEYNSHHNYIFSNWNG